MPAGSHAYARFTALPGFVRRYCGCGALNRCVCDLPRPASGWTVERLVRLLELQREGAALNVLAFELTETPHRCNVALDALLGRSPEHAIAVLEAQAGGLNASPDVSDWNDA